MILLYIWNYCFLKPSYFNILINKKLFVWMSDGKWGRRGCSKEQNGERTLTLKHSSVRLDIFILLHHLAAARWNEDTRCWIHFILSFYLEQKAIINSSLVLRLLSAMAPSWCETSEFRVVFLCPAVSAGAPLSAGSPGAIRWGSCSGGGPAAGDLLGPPRWRPCCCAHREIL